MLVFMGLMFKLFGTDVLGRLIMLFVVIEFVSPIGAELGPMFGKGPHAFVARRFVLTGAGAIMFGAPMLS